MVVIGIGRRGTASADLEISLIGKKEKEEDFFNQVNLMP